MTDLAGKDWDPGIYQRFRGLRMRPALDLLNAVPELPDGPIVDLGCGTGPMGAVLSARFPGRSLIGVDTSSNMLAEARATDSYDDLIEADIETWAADAPPALIFANASLQWLPEHAVLLPRLATMLVPGGTLAVQMPRQQKEPSHALLRRFSAEMFPDRFDWQDYRPPVATPESYVDMLEPLGQVTAWETIYHQRLGPSADGHPVRAFTQSTAARPILDRLSETEAADFLAAYDSALTWAYPAKANGEVPFPFRRFFLTLTVPT
ncbi:methyltransferase domain-containing protein [Tropicimonas isoalkanivorans]|uniref:Trans-aconitate 2-methyltransferase n=1 Tax=Tropicimonas isoalkanivorans TaxID=441112 RepID=A0A1I1NG46_9RHOB|nr:methyltransferase domain-containing protein [Tropicimonas isoalkanivorans]SFC96599.1 trans-aconitate 2-methyltransferase [Tropicimonas isoalkanivorans]